MDGISVAASCIAVIQAADQTYKIIWRFVGDDKDAKSDLDADLVPDGSEFADSDLTNNIQRDIQNIVSSCLVVASVIEDVLSGYEGKLAALSWAARGKRKVATSKVLLETNRRALSLAVDTITLATAQNIKQDTANILDDTTHMRGDIYDLVVRIRNLEAMVADKDPDDPQKYVLMRYLNDLSSVAGSTGGDGASIVKVVKTTDPEGKPKLVCKSGFLPQSREVKKGLFTFLHMDQTITAIRHVERSAILYTWKLHGDWFTDADLTRQVKEPRKLLLPEYYGSDEIAIIGIVPGSSMRVLAMRFPSDAHPEDFIITGQDLSSHQSEPLKPYSPAPGTRSYSYARTYAMGQVMVSEDRKLMQTKSSVAYGVVIRETDSMHAIQLIARKPDEWNTFSPNFDHWVHMGKDTRSGEKKPRIYIDKFEVRWPKEYHQT
ncbi:hypothetical protein FANTH_3227 [Fusarium anthophilum]|uniref:Fungal N-terminal domain-containing protein n=1 Tax=Fusarium anthophilum TaxID=48485 RepID=A0A8H5E9B8_9HYPO|nr:hypothetical protein FANTH_3227 [Fusarium anthophilum]